MSSEILVDLTFCFFLSFSFFLGLSMSLFVFLSFFLSLSFSFVAGYRLGVMRALQKGITLCIRTFRSAFKVAGGWGGVGGWVVWAVQL